MAFQQNTLILSAVEITVRNRAHPSTMHKQEFREPRVVEDVGLGRTDLR